MTDPLVSETVASLAAELGPEPDDAIAEMDERAAEEGFPVVGPTVGGWLALLVDLVDARRVFEFGSGFGYSAYWFGRALPPDGEVILTEVDAEELALAREYFESGGLAEKATFEHGDAVEIVDEYDGPFDIVLLDLHKQQYVDALRAVREKLRPGSLVLADNAVTAGPVDTADVLGLVAGESVPGASEASSGVAQYLRTVRDDDGMETVLLPLGEGVAVSRVR